MTPLYAHLREVIDNCDNFKQLREIAEMLPHFRRAKGGGVKLWNFFCWKCGINYLAKMPGCPICKEQK